MSKVRPRVAVVDDEESVRIALGRVLHWAGLDAEMFASGEEFLASTPWPDCVVLDLHMPEMSGFDVQARLLAAKAPVRVVIITGHDTPESRQRAVEGGAAAYLRKPVDSQALLDAITAVVACQTRTPGRISNWHSRDAARVPPANRDNSP